MTKIKAYTDLKQSKKLAKILPIESADMSYSIINNIGQGPYHCNIPTFTHATHEDIPCWSLTALLEVLPDGTDIIKDEADTENEKYMCTVGIKDDITSTFGNNPVDACYEMIIRLHELKKL